MNTGMGDDLRGDDLRGDDLRGYPEIIKSPAIPAGQPTPPVPARIAPGAALPVTPGVVPEKSRYNAAVVAGQAAPGAVLGKCPSQLERQAVFGLGRPSAPPQGKPAVPAKPGTLVALSALAQVVEAPAASREKAIKAAALDKFSEAEFQAALQAAHKLFPQRKEELQEIAIQFRSLISTELNKQIAEMKPENLPHLQKMAPLLESGQKFRKEQYSLDEMVYLWPVFPEAMGRHLINKFRPLPENTAFTEMQRLIQRFPGDKNEIADVYILASFSQIFESDKVSEKTIREIAEPFQRLRDRLPKLHDRIDDLLCQRMAAIFRADPDEELGVYNQIVLERIWPDPLDRAHNMYKIINLAPEATVENSFLDDYNTLLKTLSPTVPAKPGTLVALSAIAQVVKAPAASREKAIKAAALDKFSEAEFQAALQAAHKLFPQRKEELQEIAIQFRSLISTELNKQIAEMKPENLPHLQKMAPLLESGGKFRKEQYSLDEMVYLWPVFPDAMGRHLINKFRALPENTAFTEMQRLIQRFPGDKNEIADVYILASFSQIFESDKVSEKTIKEIAEPFQRLRDRLPKLHDRIDDLLCQRMAAIFRADPDEELGVYNQIVLERIWPDPLDRAHNMYKIINLAPEATVENSFLDDYNTLLKTLS